VVYDPSNPPEVTSGTPPVTTQLSRRAVVYQAVDDSNLFHFRISYTDGESVSNPDVIATLSPGDDPSTTAVEDAGAANEQITLEMSYQHFTFLTPFLGVLFESQPTGYIPLIVSQSFQNEDQ
jgi:hypothetical protein